MGTNPDFTESQKYALSVTNNIISACSFIALSLFLVGVSLKKYPKKAFSLRLLCNLFFTDLLFSVANLLCNFSYDDPVLCQIEGAIRHFGCWSTVLWATIIAYSAYSLTVNNDIKIEGKYLKMIYVGYGLPVIMAILPLFPIPVSYSYNGAYCLLTYDGGATVDASKTKMAQFFLLLAWVWLAIILTTYYYIRLFNFLKRLHITSQLLEIKKILVFPVLLFLAFIPVTIDDFAWFPKHHFAIAMTSTIFLHGLGFLNVFTYGLQRIRRAPRKVTAIDMKAEANQAAHEQSGFEFQGTVLVNAQSKFSINERTERLDYSENTEGSLKVVLMNTTL